MSVGIDTIDVPPESIAEAKAHLRIEGENEDAVIGRLIGAAIAACEAFTGTQLLIRNAREQMPFGGDWRRLSLTPVQAIAAVIGVTADGASLTLPAGSYTSEIDANGDGWVRVTHPAGAQRAIVQFSAGRAETWGDLPEALRQGIIRLAAHFYTHRDAADDGGPPAAVSALWRPWRRMRLR
ncbi:MAG: hypothetical protein JWL91_1185 [Sphingomonas bacterium]|nr:head-tail connector protein [Sphingomonas bacterium]MDB5689309.1 hypothetical protein [Sphingomonas bacterium]